MKTRQSAFVVLFSAAMVVGSVSDVFACQCGSIPAPREAAAKSKAVVAAVVTGISEAKIPIDLDGRRDIVAAKRVKLRVQRVWKGAVSPTLHLITGVTNCDFNFRVGRTFLIYVEPVTHSPENLTATICKPTKLYRDAKRDLVALGPGKAIRPSSAKES